MINGDGCHVDLEKGFAYFKIGLDRGDDVSTFNFSPEK